MGVPGKRLDPRRCPALCYGIDQLDLLRSYLELVSLVSSLSTSKTTPEEVKPKGVHPFPKGPCEKAKVLGPGWSSRSGSPPSWHFTGNGKIFPFDIVWTAS